MGKHETSGCQSAVCRWALLLGLGAGLGVVCGLIAAATQGSAWNDTPLGWVSSLWRDAFHGVYPAGCSWDCLTLSPLLLLSGWLVARGARRQSRVAGLLGVAHPCRGPGLLHGYVASWVFYGFVLCAYGTPPSSRRFPVEDLRRHALFAWPVALVFVLSSLAIAACWARRRKRMVKKAGKHRGELEAHVVATPFPPQLESAEALWEWAEPSEDEATQELPLNFDRTGAASVAKELVARLSAEKREEAPRAGTVPRAQHQASHLLLGSFGSGKSTVGAWVKRALEEDTRFAWCNLSAWPHTSAESLIRAIIDEIEHAVARHDSSFTFSSLGYHYLNAIGSTSPGLLTLLLPWRRQRDPQDIIDRLNAALTRLDLRLVVWFDDLGRFDAVQASDDRTGAHAAAYAPTETFSALRGLLDALNRAHRISVVVATESAALLARDHDRLFRETLLELPSFSASWAHQVGAVIEAELWGEVVQPFPSDDAESHTSETSGGEGVTAIQTPRPTLGPNKQLFACPPLSPPTTGDTTLPWDLFVRVSPYPRAMKHALCLIRRRLKLVGSGFFPGDIVALSVLEAVHPLLVRDLLATDVLSAWCRTRREIGEPITLFDERHNSDGVDSKALELLEAIRTFCIRRIREPDARASADVISWLVSLPNWPEDSEPRSPLPEEYPLSIQNEPAGASIILGPRELKRELSELLTLAAHAKRSGERTKLVNALLQPYLDVEPATPQERGSHLLKTLANHIETHVIPEIFLEVCDGLMTAALESAGRNEVKDFSRLLEQLCRNRLQGYLFNWSKGQRDPSRDADTREQQVATIVGRLSDARVAASLPLALATLDNLELLRYDRLSHLESTVPAINDTVASFIGQVTAEVERGTFVLSSHPALASYSGGKHYLIFKDYNGGGKAPRVRRACLELAKAYARSVARDAANNWRLDYDELLTPLWYAATGTPTGGSFEFHPKLLRGYVAVEGAFDQEAYELIEKTLATYKPRPVAARAWRSLLDGQFERLVNEFREHRATRN